MAGKPGSGRPITLPEPEPRACKNCGVIFTPIRKKYKQQYCGLKCQRSKFLITDNNAELSRRTAEQRGNTLRGRGEGIAYPKINGRHAHIVVMERKLGRALKPGEIVHHINDDILDYSEDNLELKPSQSVHAREHMQKYWKEIRDREDRLLAEYFANNKKGGIQ